jgi:hypothetical protein
MTRQIELLSRAVEQLRAANCRTFALRIANANQLLDGARVAATAQCRDRRFSIAERIARRVATALVDPRTILSLTVEDHRHLIEATESLLRRVGLDDAVLALPGDREWDE